MSDRILQQKHLELPEPIPEIDFDEAVRLGIANGNQLLLDYCAEYAQLQYPRWTPPLLRNKPPLRWLDTALMPNEQSMTTEQLLRGKIYRTQIQIQALMNGDGYMCYVDVPAYNEAGEIPKLIASLRSQIVSTPVALVVADNNSRDKTSTIVQEQGGNALLAVKQGAGAAREVALNGSLEDTPASFEQTIIVQTDADSLMYPAYLNSVIHGFHENPDMHIGVGPSQYTIPTERDTTLRITGGKAYGELLGTLGIRGYFETYNRDPQDYLLEPPFRYLVGPNTTLRASLFTEHGLAYRTDGRWEVLDLAIRSQQKLSSSKAISYLDGQFMEVSPRAILGGDEVLTSQRLQDIRAAGYVGMYKKGKSQHTPFTTMETVLQEIDAKTYNLAPNQRVAGIVSEDHPLAKVYETTPAIHAATSHLLMGKVALIA